MRGLFYRTQLSMRSHNIIGDDAPRRAPDAKPPIGTLPGQYALLRTLSFSKGIDRNFSEDHC